MDMTYCWADKQKKKEVNPGAAPDTSVARGGGGGGQGAIAPPPPQ